MLIIAQHDINNPEAFWGAAQEVTKNMPSNLKLHSVYPSKDAKSGTCIWEADKVQDVQQFLDTNAGKFAKNTCFEVDVEKSMGIPETQKAEAVI